MKIYYIIVSVLMTLLLDISKISAMETVTPALGTNSWLPARLTNEQEANIRKIIRAEESAFIIPNPENKNYRFGRSFTIDIPQVMCLQEICKRYELDNNIRPKVADFGAGFGLMTWKIILAGGDVFAVEPQDPTRDILMKNAKQAVPFLNRGETLKNVSRCSKVSVLDFDKCPAYKEKADHYDITWSGNLLHLFTPSEATAYVKNLYNITKPGGYAFATVHGPCISKSMLSFFLERKKANTPFPGYCVANMAEQGFRYYPEFNGAPQKVMTPAEVMKKPGERGEFIYSPLDTEENWLSPTCRKEGFYRCGQEPCNTPSNTGEVGFFEEVYIDQILARPYHEAECRYHIAYHSFDRDSLKTLFEQAGFSVELSFHYHIRSNHLVESDISMDMMDTDVNHIWVGIKALKPLKPLKP